ncbi:uncharacterized protein EI90DRAFT_3123912 [Cantharellus anzutake]|uniref:uncharacterized protein n=1 Tax=Cantharellus anzutake TaxID=1750568 RepID=UPI0019040C69|nr:uncharacterized protein EI90DRAFT_3123912 [Cantharellus anzutake]KAF8330692.1 hypothetical protein EI90DRAFT_3123912 [Cantharellus anzutake]
MEAKLPKKVDRWGGDATNYEAQFNDLNPSIFGNGIIELIDVDQSQPTISRFQLDAHNYPAPLNFPMGATLVTEDNEENVSPYPW